MVITCDQLERTVPFRTLNHLKFESIALFHYPEQTFTVLSTFIVPFKDWYYQHFIEKLYFNTRPLNYRFESPRAKLSSIVYKGKQSKSMQVTIERRS